LGLVVAESQHGLVSRGHDAYNVAPALSMGDASRETLPEYFLAYEAWWSQQMNVPVQSVVIGNPRREEQLGRLCDTASVKTDALVLGDGIETEWYLGLARQLVAMLPAEWRVVFRPHPMERKKVEAWFPAGMCERVHIDLN